MTDARSERIRAVPKIQLAANLDLDEQPDWEAVQVEYLPQHAAVDEAGLPVVGPKHNDLPRRALREPRRAKVEGESWD